MVEERERPAEHDPSPNAGGPVAHRHVPTDAELNAIAPLGTHYPQNDAPLADVAPPLDRAQHERITDEAMQYTLTTTDTATRIMSYRAHLEELRDRLIKSLVALVITIIFSLMFTNSIFDILKSRAEGLTLIRTGVAEMIGTYMKVAVISGVVFATPVWLYQLIAFISPGLQPGEKRFLIFALPAVLFSFFTGVLFGYFVLLPPALNFLIHFGEDIAQPLIRVGDYVSVVTSLLFWIGACFETPLVIYLLARLGVVTPQKLVAYRRYAYVGAFVLGAFITPTFDPVNQTLVAIPLAFLYELGIVLSRFAARARAGA